MISFTTGPDLTVQTSGATGAVIVTFVAADSVYKYVGATIDWGDGSYDALSSTTGSLAGTLGHSYGGFGKFVIKVTAFNRALPLAQIAEWSGEADFTAAGFVPVDNALLDPAVIGPILPVNRGAGALDSWSFDLGTDDQCIMSSLYLLLTTAKGERLMMPGYGTNLRRLVFSLVDSGLDDAIRADVSQSVAQWEPRAQLDSITVSRTGSTITVNAAFRSLVSGTNLPVQVSVS